MLKMQPIGEYILVQKIIKEKPQGTIITLHEIDANEPQYKVISAGSDAQIVKHNDIIYISKYNTHPLKIDNQEFLLVKKEHVLGIVNGS